MPTKRNTYSLIHPIIQTNRKGPLEKHEERTDRAEKHHLQAVSERRGKGIQSNFQEDRLVLPILRN